MIALTEIVPPDAWKDTPLNVHCWYCGRLEGVDACIFWKQGELVISCRRCERPMIRFPIKAGELYPK